MYVYLCVRHTPHSQDACANVFVPEAHNVTDATLSIQSPAKSLEMHSTSTSLPLPDKGEAAPREHSEVSWREFIAWHGIENTTRGAHTTIQ